jgi:hypothetical protein
MVTMVRVNGIYCHHNHGWVIGRRNWTVLTSTLKVGIGVQTRVNGFRHVVKSKQPWPSNNHTVLLLYQGRQ